MKLQGMSIVFALVIVPIILVLSYYIGLQVDTIEVQTTYDSKLLDSTYDAMSAFELNIANEDLSTVSDSLRTIIEASYKVFINNLATNLGMSNANKSYVEPFIPSVLYTLYDGYYICAPTKVPTVLTDSDGNAVAVGDEGVTGSSGNYSYDENSKNLLNSSVGIDYGQLLYLKAGSSNTYTTNIDEAKLETKNVLKTYMPYSARYTGANFDLTIVYTLDNYVTIEGTIAGVYYTKSGYLIPKDSVTIGIANPSGGYSTDVDIYSQNDIEYVIENRLADFTVTVNDGTNTTIVLSKGQSKASLKNKINVLNNALEQTQELWHSINYTSYNTAMDKVKEIYKLQYFENLRDNYHVIDLEGGDWSGKAAQIEAITPYNTDPNNNKLYNSSDMEKVAQILKSLIVALEAEIRNTQYELDTIASVVYYSKARIFSNWVNDYLFSSGTEGGCELLEDNLVEVAGQKYSTIKGVESLEFDFKTGAKVFSLDGTAPVSVTEIAKDSVFYQHKLNVIKMSIQYNLNLAMSTYNNNESYLFEYKMPVIQAKEWEQILTHISITSFMQGMKCGLKTYNNYKIVSSTNNDILPLPEQIYYVKKDEFNNESSEYHRINCNKVVENDAANIEYMAFGSKEVKYDKIANKNRDHMSYEYDHKNYACYDCINDGNYLNRDTDSDGKNDTQINIFDTTDTNYNSYSNLRKAYYIGVAKERNNTYKMNSFINSQGYEVLKIFDTAQTSKLGIDKVQAIELAIGTIYSENASIRSAIYTFNYNNNTVINISNDTYSIATNNSSNDSTQSIRINIIPGKNVGTEKFTIGKLNPKCENASEIIKPSVDADGNPTGGEDAEKQFENAIKYVRIIYK